MAEEKEDIFKYLDAVFTGNVEEVEKYTTLSEEAKKDLLDVKKAREEMLKSQAAGKKALEASKASTNSAIE